MDIFRRVKSRVCDFSDFLLSWDFTGQNLTFREIPRSGDAKCTTEWQNVTQFRRKNLLKTKKRSSPTISIKFLHFCLKKILLLKS